MKSTPEQRAAWKMKRRFSSWRDLVAALHHWIRRSQRTLEVSDKAVKALHNHPFLSQIQDAIRSAN